MNDKIIARLRTAIPALWGALVTALITAIPSLPAEVTNILNSEVVILALVAGATWLWHWLWTRVGPHIPDWLESIVMGHAGQASYDTFTRDREGKTNAPDVEDDLPVEGDNADPEM